MIARHGSRRALWAIVLLAVMVRAAVMARGTLAFDDPDNYLPLARVAGRGRRLHAQRASDRVSAPTLSSVLAPLFAGGGTPAVWGVALLHLALGAGTVWLTAAAAKGSGLSPARTAVAAFITACDPVLVWQSRSVMTETPAAFLIAAALAAVCLRGWRGPVLGGIGFGLAALCRPSVLAGAMLAIVAAIVVKPGEPRARLVRGGLLALAIALVLSPWMIRNALVFGEPVWTTTHGGYTLALANNPVYYREVLNGPPGRVWTGHDQWLWWDSVNTATAGMTEPQADRYLTAQVWALARQQPVDFGRAMLARLAHFWSVAPAAAVYPAGVRYLSMAWTIPLWVALAFGLLQPGLWSWPRIVAPAIAVGLAAVHLFFWTDLRMRAPIVPAIALIAAGAAMKRPGPADASAAKTTVPMAQETLEG